MELNAEQIKEHIELCMDRPNCAECPNLHLCDGNGFEHILGKALALITSQEQRIKELMSTSPLQGAIIGCLRTTANELTADKERLEKLLDDKCDRCIERERADTVRKMQERFALRYGTYTDKDLTPIIEVFSLLDQIAKEMIENDGG